MTDIVNPGKGYYDLAPGNVLQNLYIKKRLKEYIKPSMKFVELGAGNGNMSKILLDFGLIGVGYDLSDVACSLNYTKNKIEIDAKKYQVKNDDFFNASNSDKVDIIISSHVLEHMPSDLVDAYFEKCKSIMNPGAKIISLVPSNMRFWGVEDETVGHHRRYSFDDFEKISKDHHLKIDDISYLTYPLSNILLGISNRLISKSESWKKKLTMEEQTVLSASGTRNVKYKTFYPSYFRYFINEVTMYPFHLLQIWNKRNPSSMILYCELSLRDTTEK